MRITVFTLLYLAAGICLTAIALQQPDLSLSFKRLLLTAAALLYLFTVLSSFRHWQQGIYRFHNQSTWLQKLFPWLIITVTLFSIIFEVLTNQPMTDVTAFCIGTIPLILVCVEWIFRTQIQP